MNERNKQNRDAVRQMTSGQTPAEVEAQKSLTTANPDWITSDDKKSPRQKSHDSRRGVRQARESLAEKVLSEFEDRNADLRTAGGRRTMKATQKKAGRQVAKRRAIAKEKGEEYRSPFNPDAPRRRVHNASRGVKKTREALAEMVLEAVKRKNTAVQDLKPKDLNKLETGLKKAKPGRVAKATKRPPAPKKVKTKNKKSDVLMRAGSSSSNHPDYLKKKLYNRATKDGGYGKEGKPTAANTEVNQQGVRGHEAKIAKKKKKSARQEKSQRMSNKIRTMRGLVPLMPGEKHSSNDKLGKTEN